MTEEKEVLLTREGYEKLERELAELKSVKRKEVAEQIKEALSLGDISENAEYENAKNNQAFIEGRIATLEKILAKARIISAERSKNVVSLGSKVVLRDVELN
ncbi:GreA/GreB family elongation factor [Carboxydothermus ferrireducens]|uniref:Transcription elongation factor GreA n=1 Tax=Carboxydothermus ferrireducens DSM 11255 TaxID=1119529 RepID=A0ABX2RBG4_9THEO|nr:hypothetical protein [Carboxydothermus ferrireducens]NYE57128.1 transcription elongation factor GreA [Carboxydothermus ferrireducens DSM 11255]